MCPNVGATHWVALGHSCQRARSRLGQTNREAVPRAVGGAGRHSCQRARSRLGQTNREAVPAPRARQCLAPTRAKSSMCPNVGATHWVALGHSCQRARSRPGQTNREAVPRSGGRARRRMRARQCLAPTRSGQKLHVSQRRGDPLGRPRSFMPTRSFTAGTNKSRGRPALRAVAAQAESRKSMICWTQISIESSPECR